MTNSKMKKIGLGVAVLVVLVCLVCVWYRMAESPVIRPTEETSLLSISFQNDTGSVSWAPVTEADQETEAEILAFLADSKAKRTFQTTAEQDGTLLLGPNARNCLQIQVRDPDKITSILLLAPGAEGSRNSIAYQTDASTLFKPWLRWERIPTQPEEMLAFVLEALDGTELAQAVL